MAMSTLQYMVQDKIPKNASVNSLSTSHGDNEDIEAVEWRRFEWDKWRSLPNYFIFESHWIVNLRVRHILHVKIGSGQSHSLCYGGTMGNGYFRTSQTSSSSRQREKR
ncbi:hypothetical protein M5D96_006325 [Drosophila gunungcola]|uniref:Uncharacterized protein n=1 Tax=Drosophila gunungcola TaxID=103775 RepID=A0A9Q0BQP9_9MUSC|nr:hypothetical protein M5D96_006325 [Drosophila gunungcola]